MKTIQLSAGLRATALALLAMFMTATYSAFAQENSDVTTEDRNVSGFHAIEIGGAFRVTLIQGEKEGLTIEGEPDFLKHVVTKVSNGTLDIHTDKQCKTGRAGTLTIYFKNVNEIECSGSVNLSAKNKLEFDKLDLSTSGASKTVLSLSASHVDVDISGASHTELSGSANDVELDISGSGKYLAADLKSESCSIEISGVGSAEVDASKKLDISVSGSGAISYKGNPQITKSISGSGKITKMD